MSDPLRLTLQDSLGSAFTLKAELGGGGMSRVFVAREEALGRDVVVKVLAPELAEGMSVERFAREIRLAAALQEPHIVPVLTTGVTTLGMPYYTMPFVRGASLRERMNEGPIPASEALQLLRDVAQALAYAHAQGVVHRDIKPENILLSSGTAVVTDFGIAKALRASRTEDADGVQRAGITRTGMSLGTPAYMAPEQAAGDPDTDQRADLYAWGVVAYEMLAGRHPFAESTSPQQLLTAHMVEMPTPLVVSGGVAPALVALVMHCLAKDPVDRPASASAMVQQLSGVTTDGAGVSSVSHATLVAGSRSRRTKIIGAAAVLAMVLAGAWWRGTSRIASSARGAAETAGPVMMAVLPFEHAGPADQQPFTDGLTDAVTAKLGGLSSLLVIDRRSAATYRGTTKSTQQIGTELGVRYLLEGVVRWAKDGAGVWRARVTPTLVDAKSGAIKWTGEPAEVTLTDPFTAQGSIATDVAQAMEVAVLPKERVALTRRFTENPEAYAAYQRGVSALDALQRNMDYADLRGYEGVAREMEIALALDSNFTMAWGQLAKARVIQARIHSNDSAMLARARNVLRTALKRAAKEPFVHIASSWAAIEFDHDSVGALVSLSTAMTLAPNDAEVLSLTAGMMRSINYDSAKALIYRAARLDPRSPEIAARASGAAARRKDFATARRYANTVLELDSTDERGWSSLFYTQLSLGDSIGMRRFSDMMLQHVAHPGVNMAGYTPPANKRMSQWYLDLPPRDQRLFSFSDTLTFFDNRIDAAVVLGDETLARRECAALVRLFNLRRAHFDPTPDELAAVAYAQATVGQELDARHTLDRAIGLAQKRTPGQYPIPEIDGSRVASVYDRLGDVDNTVAWMDASLRGWATTAWYRIHPRLAKFRTTQAWRDFEKSHPVQAR